MFGRIPHPGTSALAVALLVGLPTLGTAGPWRPRIGVEAGPSLGRLNSTGIIGNGGHWTLGGSAGLVARWDLGPGWALEAAPGWERPAGRGTGKFALNLTGGPGMSSEFDQTVSFDRVALPMRAVFHPGRSGWSLEGGVSASWLARADRTSAVTTEPSATSSAAMARRREETAATIFEGLGTFDSNDWTRLFHRWDLAAVAGVGWDHPIASHLLRARVRWQQGFTDIGKFDEPVRVSAATAGVGLLW